VKIKIRPFRKKKIKGGFETMNKNLKKVISAAAALAVSASSIAAFAASYPDVADTASYAQAVEELSTLGVINGYDDGTFGPDNNITRAEFAKMTVYAMGTNEVEQANSAAGQDTQFTDVPGTHWAAGWVKQGTVDGFINGYSDTEFGPGDNITYAQAVKMLVCAVGYDAYAQKAGGWPSGYLSYGVKLGITSGVKAATDEIVTRAQVAQMIDNAIKAPICVQDYTTNAWGNQAVEYTAKDTTSEYIKDSWQSLLDYGHDVYDVYGRVTATHQSGDVKNDEVKVQVEKSNNFDGYQVVSGSSISGEKEYIMYIGDSKADQYLFTYAEMLIQKDEDDEYTVLTINPQGKNTTETFNASDVDDDYTIDDTIRAYKDGASKSTSYKLNQTSGATDVDVYVNGVKLDLTNTTLEAVAEEYIYNNASGTVTLIDSPDAGKSSSDGYYDYIMITYYKDAIVDSVRVNSDTETVVYFDDSAFGASQWTVDTDDDTVAYEFYLDGASITAADLQEDDVLSIAYNPVKGFTDTVSYTAYVSRDVVTGTVNAVDEDTDATKTEYTLSDGNVYKISDENLITSTLTAGDDYTLYLNAFGRIAKYDTEASSKLIGILDAVYKSNGGDYYANVFTKTGEKVTYSLKDNAKYKEYVGYCYENSDVDDDKLAIQDRVVQYKVNSKNELTISSVLGAKNSSNTELTYKSSSNKLGSYSINDALTTIIDYGDYADDSTVAAITSSGLDNDDTYTAYVYDKNSDGSYSFILIDANGSGYSVDSELVIYSKVGTQSIDGETKDTVYVYAGDDAALTAYILDDSYVTASDLSGTFTEGDALILKTNSSNEVTGFTAAFASSYNKKIKSSYESFFNLVTSASNLDDVIKPANDLADDISYNASGEKKKHYVNFYFGPIVDKTDTSITLGRYTSVEGKATDDATTTSTFDRITNKDADSSIYDLTFDSDVKVTVYDYSRGSSSRVVSGVKGSIVKTQVSKSNCIAVEDVASTGDKSYINWRTFTADGNKGEVNYALVKSVDDDVTEVYVILPSSN
jgi:hypothetical protein